MIFRAELPIASRIFLVDEFDFYTFETRQTIKKTFAEKKFGRPYGLFVRYPFS